MKKSNLVNRIFATENMVKENLRLGDITPSREAYKTTVDMALPAVAEMVSISLIGMVDTVMVGRLGPYAVAAVGLTGQPRLIFMSFFMALNVGVVAIVSRRKGEGNRESANLCLRQALSLEIVMSILLSLVAVSLAVPLMGLAGANEDTLTASSSYFRIISAGLVLQAMSATICAAQRGVGNTKITMTVNLTANIVNVITNFLLIEGRFGFPRLEIEGAAISTIISASVGFTLALRSVLRRDAYLRISVRDNWKPDLPMIKLISRVGGSSMIEQLALRIGFFSYARVVAGLGTNDFAAHQIAMQLMNLSYTFAEGIGSASTALVGQNIGKKRPDLSIMYGNIGQRLAMFVSAVLMILSLSGRSFFPGLFTDDPGIIETTSRLMAILAFIQPVQTSQIILAGGLRGAGDTRFVAFTMLGTVAFVRPVVSLIFVYILHFGLAGAWYAIMVDQVLRFIMVSRRFSKGNWIKIRI